MPTSSIFTNIRITTEEQAKAFIAALEKSEELAKGEVIKMPDNIRFVTVHDEIRRMYAKRFEKQCSAIRHNSHLLRNAIDREIIM